MKRFGIGLLCGVCGYVLAAFVGYFLIDWFSPNMHDRSVEAAMTSAFVIGPLGGAASFVAGFIRGGHTSLRATQVR